MTYELTTTGNPDNGFTSVEIEMDGEYIGRVFELESGWYVHLQNMENLMKAEFVEAISTAKDRLLHYVNRKGCEFPEGTTRAGVSLWLMQRNDGKGFTIS